MADNAERGAGDKKPPLLSHTTTFKLMMRSWNAGAVPHNEANREPVMGCLSAPLVIAG